MLHSATPSTPFLAPVGRTGAFSEASCARGPWGRAPFPSLGRLRAPHVLGRGASLRRLVAPALLSSCVAPPPIEPNKSSQRRLISFECVAPPPARVIPGRRATCLRMPVRRRPILCREESCLVSLAFGNDLASQLDLSHWRGHVAPCMLTGRARCAAVSSGARPNAPPGGSRQPGPIRVCVVGAVAVLSSL